MFRKNKDEASTRALTTGLPQERKALAERYTIDAKEAESRTDQVAEETRRREAEFAARRAAAVQARREPAERPRHVVLDEVRRDGDEAPVRRDPVQDPPAPNPPAVAAATASAGGIPIYGWMQQATAPPDTRADWTRALLRTALEEQREKASRV